jgi:hypothetical protein
MATAVDDPKYVIADLDPSERHGYITIGVTKLGEKSPDYFCSDPDSHSMLRCSLGTINMRVNLKALRYMKIYPEGYIDDGDHKGDTPNIEIGRCSKI